MDLDVWVGFLGKMTDFNRGRCDELSDIEQDLSFWKLHLYLSG